MSFDVLTVVAMRYDAAYFGGRESEKPAPTLFRVNGVTTYGRQSAVGYIETAEESRSATKQARVT